MSFLLGQLLLCFLENLQVELVYAKQIMKWESQQEAFDTWNDSQNESGGEFETALE
ncbi:unnamed protein product [Paramecium octaurelia]|uniref:Uncharacterized protein n=1 Tax=Paramecium octaurelia TaxID=43137 RepID=A0A8S1TYM2_PAROT|nr:unnamed protein product [Paramecium octaurelia]